MSLITRSAVSFHTYLQEESGEPLQPRWDRTLEGISGQGLLDILMEDSVSARKSAASDHSKQPDELSLISHASIYLSSSEECRGLNRIFVDFNVARGCHDTALENVDKVNCKLQVIKDSAQGHPIVHNFSGQKLVDLLKSKAAQKLCSTPFLNAVKNTVPLTRKRTVAAYNAVIVMMMDLD